MLGAKAEELLPVSAAREHIEAALAESGALILSAPPGTGKSTQVPRFLLDRPGQVSILQPRRIAARALAARVAEEMEEPLGKIAGYQVRFENASGPETRLLFQTYGTFRQRLLREPDLPGVQAVVLDEFHERAWEADFILLGCRELRRRRPDLRLIVMSATLDSGELAVYLPEAARISVEGRLFPVDIRHQTPRLHETLPQQILRALKSLSAGGWSGSALVFLPGGGEIRWVGEHIASFCRESGITLRELHGSLALKDQQAALRAPGNGSALILCTNVAETSLTVPGVTAVIDAGLHRVAAYDPDRDTGTLFLRPIALANATQRAGRAGRTAPGICIRLWEAERETRMEKSLEPEVRRAELSEAALSLHALIPGATAAWLTPPDPALWKKAEEKLWRVSAVRNGTITPLGKSLLGWPAPPELARVLHDTAETGDLALHRQIAAMAAIMSASRKAGKNSDLYALGEELSDPETRGFDRETVDAFRQFQRQMEKHAQAGKTATEKKDQRLQATRLFLPVFIHRLATRVEGQSFALADGRKGVAAGVPAETKLLLALEMHESGGKDRARQTTIPLFLPVEPAWVEAEFPGECHWEKVEEFDSKQGKVLREERLLFRELILDRRAVAETGGDAGELLAEKLIRGEIELPFDDESRQWMRRIRLAHRVCPDSGMPALDAEDWGLIYHEICEGKRSVKQLQDVSVSSALRDYLGPALTAFLEREAPTHVKLPQGKRGGKITYFENSPPELSARLGDFLGMEGGFKILRGRVEVTYDILAPNYRTVQKTKDLTSFWKNSYPEVKQELKRKYPRHPWP